MPGIAEVVELVGSSDKSCAQHLLDDTADQDYRTFLSSGAGMYSIDKSDKRR